jgi:nucleoside-diphosphate-sugar epimerase
VSSTSGGKILIAGATGNVGSGALRHFASLPEWEVVSVSRRTPPGLDGDANGTQHISVDLADKARCAEVFGAMDDVTHVIYAAVFEKPDVVEGWRARDQIERNGAMLSNLFDPLEAASAGLRHISVLEGTKAYGIHVHWPAEPFSTPAREREPRHPHENFYWLHEDYIRAKREGKQWRWTVWRPQLIVGDPVGSNLSVIAVIGAYAALERAAGRDLAYPGGPAYPVEAIDVDILAHAMEWATTTDASHDETFNINNGDVFQWPNVWPAIADELGMRIGQPKPQSMSATMPQRDAEWARVVAEHDLAAPTSLAEFIGLSTGLADFTFAYGSEHTPPPNLVSTIKLRQAGFAECIDTEDMLRKWIARLQELRYIPQPDA